MVFSLACSGGCWYDRLWFGSESSWAFAVKVCAPALLLQLPDAVDFVKTLHGAEPSFILSAHFLIRCGRSSAVIVVLHLISFGQQREFSRRRRDRSACVHSSSGHPLACLQAFEGAFILKQDRLNV